MDGPRMLLLGCPWRLRDGSMRPLGGGGPLGESGVVLDCSRS